MIDDSIFDYVIYGDTDSLFLNIGKFIEHQGLSKIWAVLEEDERIQYIKDISTEIVEYVNDNVYDKVQQIHYNSQEHEYRINFKQEIVCESGIFIAKKKYYMKVIDNEGHRPSDPLKVTGLEVIRSDTPTVVRDILKEFMAELLENNNDSDLIAQIDKCKEILQKSIPEDIAINKGCRNIGKYINSETLEHAKGTPSHIKGVAAYKKLLNELDLVDNYPEIEEGEKAKNVYIKKNPWHIDSVTFIRWPKEFEKHGIHVDYKKMIEKQFSKKVEMLLDPMGKKDILYDNSSVLNLFFQM